MRLHLIISRDNANKIRVDYLGADRGESLKAYDAAGKAGDIVEMFGYLTPTRKRKIPAAPAPVAKK